MASTNTSEAILGIYLKHHEDVVYPIQAFPTGYIYISYTYENKKRSDSVT